ncbi:MAG TPA: FkbM family methyltransferase [Edaphobacter sp.]|jgi:FkbM family methyltransferase|nr:FkbM family methyltransferase [Edaphobacter sp.]
MSSFLDAFTATRAGSIVYRPLQQLVHLSRRRANPDIPLNHELIHVSYRDRHFHIEVERWNTSQRLAVDQCFTVNQYDMLSGAHATYIERLYTQILASGKKPLILDCGANIGASVLWFTARYPDAHIIAVEPAPDNFALLRKNCAKLDVDLHEAGVGPVDGHASLCNPFGESMSYQTNTHNNGIDIEMVSIGTLLTSLPPSAYSPFLLKLDIEGAEKPLFGGDTSVIDQFPLIIIEPHDWLLPGQQSSVEFFRFHAAAGREFQMKHENIASIAHHPNLHNQ